MNILDMLSTSAIYRSLVNNSIWKDEPGPWELRASEDILGSRPVSVLGFWISECLTQAESSLQGVEFSCPWGISSKCRVNKS